jgi:hypothetical protein
VEPQRAASLEVLARHRQPGTRKVLARQRQPQAEKDRCIGRDLGDESQLFWRSQSGNRKAEAATGNKEGEGPTGEALEDRADKTGGLPHLVACLLKEPHLKHLKARSAKEGTDSGQNRTTGHGPLGR